MNVAIEWPKNHGRRLKRLLRILNPVALPSPPLLFIAFFTLHRSPLSERLEQAMS